MTSPFDFQDKVILAPMAGVTSAAMRELCLQAGADLAYTEMVSAKGLSYHSAKTQRLLDLAPSENSVAVQLFGHEPDVVASQAAWIEDALGEKLTLVDINMGCPARKIVTKGDGSALMKDPALAAQIVKATVSAISAPVTCKFRRGWAEGEETAPEFAKAMEHAGAAAITVHGRFAEQMYRGKSDIQAVARVKQAVTIPVIGNGDVFDGPSYLRLKEESGCDSVMVARGAQGNPWIFQEIKAVNSGEVFSEPTAKERVAMAIHHCKLHSQLSSQPLVSMRKHACWYVSGLPGAREARGQINAATTIEDFEAVLGRLLARCEEEA